MRYTFLTASLWFAISALIAASCAPAKAASENASRIARVEANLMTPVVIKGRRIPRMTLQSRMRFYRIPAVSIAFFDASGIRWVRAYGAHPDSLFQAGSISKPVSAVGMMRAVQDGYLKLDQNVNDVLRNWKVPQNAFTAKQPVTLRELLTMTAGTTVGGFDGYERGRPVPTLEEILDGRPPANSPPVRVDLQPGTAFRYSGGGYVIAELLLLGVIHTTYAQYMHENVLAPFGMTNSTFEQPLPQALWSRAVKATDANGKTYAGDWRVYPEQTAAGLWSTATDLAKFGIGMRRALIGASNTVLSEKNAQLMLTAVKDSYGMGFESHGRGPGQRFGHTGANLGFQNDLVFFRNGQGVAIMTDSDNGLQLIAELLNSIASVYGWNDFKPKAKAIVAMSPLAYKRFVGRYVTQGATFTVSQRGNALFIDYPLGRMQLYPSSRSTFFALGQDLDFTFRSDASGKVRELVIPQLGSEGIAKRVNP